MAAGDARVIDNAIICFALAGESCPDFAGGK